MNVKLSIVGSDSVGKAIGEIFVTNSLFAVADKGIYCVYTPTFSK